jgi:CRP-like cAMP-binding protein
MRTSDSVADALRRTARYGSITRRERQAISQAATRLDVPAGTVLASEGTLHRQFVIVLTGAATVRSNGQIKSALLAGDHFGDFEICNATSNTATVVAETEMSVAVVSPGEFDTLIERSPTLAKAVLETMADRARPAASAKPQRSSVNWKLRGLLAAARSAAPRSTQKSFPSGSAIQTQPSPLSPR